MPAFASRPLITSSAIPVELPQNYVADSKDSKYRNYNSINSLIPHHSRCRKTRFNTLVSNGSDFPLEVMLWIKEVDMVDSLDELKSSRSVIGKDFPNFEMLDAKIAWVLNKIIQNSQF